MDSLLAMRYAGPWVQQREFIPVGPGFQQLQRRFMPPLCRR
jgi:hypothetical protein